MIVLRAAVFLALGALLDPCSKLGIRADKSAQGTTPEAPAAPAPPTTPEQVTMAEANKLCAAGDCLTAHDRVEMALPPNSPFRQSAEYKTLQDRWAKSAVDSAAIDPDVESRRKVLQEVIASPVIDPPLKAQAKQTLASLPTVPPPGAATQAAAPDAGAAPEKPSKSRHRSHESRKGKEKEEK